MSAHWDWLAGTGLDEAACPSFRLQICPLVRKVKRARCCAKTTNNNVDSATGPSFG